MTTISEKYILDAINAARETKCEDGIIDRAQSIAFDYIERMISHAKKYEVDPLTPEKAVFFLGGYLSKMTPEERKRTVEEWSKTYFA